MCSKAVSCTIAEGGHKVICLHARVLTSARRQDFAMEPYLAWKARTRNRRPARESHALVAVSQKVQISPASSPNPKVASKGASLTGVAIFLMCCWAVERPLLARSVTTLALAFLQTELTLNRMLLYIDPTALNPYNSSSAFLCGM